MNIGETLRIVEEYAADMPRRDGTQGACEATDAFVKTWRQRHGVQADGTCARKSSHIPMTPAHLVGIQKFFDKIPEHLQFTLSQLGGCPELYVIGKSFHGASCPLLPRAGEGSGMRDVVNARLFQSPSLAVRMSACMRTSLRRQTACRLKPLLHPPTPPARGRGELDAQPLIVKRLLMTTSVLTR
ncbi:MAG: hypothetical protein A3I66_12115 [Burkholderiales bacterium RIFCSPLOWO2_02_FULL_57_36]|nr:MAG: hypothetical protein A3I66_12115 [Burkholderiales bacterium RIFCSPLOWO2_02_FULL_57_36]